MLAVGDENQPAARGGDRLDHPVAGEPGLDPQFAGLRVQRRDEAVVPGHPDQIAQPGQAVEAALLRRLDLADDLVFAGGQVEEREEAVLARDDGRLVAQRQYRAQATGPGRPPAPALGITPTPGGYQGVTPQLPSRGALVHTNHFISPVPGSQDVGHYAMADSLIRLQRVDGHIAGNEAPATVEALHAALSDHADFPTAVCCHPSPRSEDGLQGATVMSVIMDLDERVMYLSEGNPCQHPPGLLSFDGLLDKPSPLAAMRDCVERASRGSGG
jgi:hypothetical protein